LLEISTADIVLEEVRTGSHSTFKQKQSRVHNESSVFIQNIPFAGQP
jgi:hypothetical protein